MSYTQVIKPNVNVKGRLGWCLEYVQDAYGVPWAGSSAWDAWTKRVKKKHTNALPKGVYVPIWFDGYWDGVRYGHVAIYKDGTVWSSPWDKQTGHSKLSSIKEVERIYSMKYVGWSEDIGGKQVIKEKGMTKTEKKYYDLGRKAEKYKWEAQAKAAKELAEKIAKLNQTESWLKKLSKLALVKR